MKLFAFEGFSVCLCVNNEWNSRHCGHEAELGCCGWGGYTHSHTSSHTFVNTFSLTCMKRLFRPCVPLQAQLWSVTLFRENISFARWWLLFYKKAKPMLKIAWLVWDSGRMKQTLSGTQMLKTTFIFHSVHVTALLFFDTNETVFNTHCCWALMPAFEQPSYRWTTLEPFSHSWNSQRAKI